MTLDPRKQKVLRAVTVDYIGSAEPVASQTIARKYNLGVSPATIRNDMADLEEEGYLRQPHTSAGRIPSDKGYRFYVDVLMEPEPLPEGAEERIWSAVYESARDLDQAFRQALRLLTMLTDNAAVVFGPGLERRQIRHLQLVPLDNSMVIVVLVTEPGFVRSQVAELGQPLDKQVAERLSHALTALLRGATPGALDRGVQQQVEETVPDPVLRRNLLEVLCAEEERPGDGRVQAEGTGNLLKQPEFHDVARVREFLSLLEGQDTLVELLGRVTSRGGVTVQIGCENEEEELHPYSLVAAPFGYQGHPAGTVGVIGPTRMAYARTINVVSLVAACLGELLERFGR